MATRAAVQNGTTSDGYVRDVIQRATPSVPAARAAGVSKEDGFIAAHVLPAWCHMTGHTHLGPVPGERPVYALELTADSRPTHTHLDSGPMTNTHSTIVDITDTAPALLREGAVSAPRSTTSCAAADPTGRRNHAGERCSVPIDTQVVSDPRACTVH
ncbi:hypothetical protein [Streptomyces sp. NPDC060035]|uniref:hypothetical protein n=1 Tax=Streptomyces sp. NPDC060035 TaxID=3347044 RepID=UPI0036C03956